MNKKRFKIYLNYLNQTLQFNKVIKIKYFIILNK